MLVDTTVAAMGSEARLYAYNGRPDLEPSLRARLEQLEQSWSRFIESSEVCRVNAAGGAPVRVSPDTMLLFRRAVTASRLTRGWFDPTLLRELETAGYDRPFDELPSSDLADLVITIDRSSPAGQVQIHDWGARCRLIEMDAVASTIAMPVGMGFDPGGIGKGLAADVLLADALEAGAGACLIDLGGDIATGGQPPPEGWPINIEDPFQPGTAHCRIRIPWGSVATSSRAKRRWQSAGSEHHHLIDPATGEPSSSDVASATVVAGPCWQAESYAKAALLAGVEVGLDLLAAAALPALLIDADGQAHMTGDMADFVCEARA